MSSEHDQDPDKIKAERDLRENMPAGPAKVEKVIEYVPQHIEVEKRVEVPIEVEKRVEVEKKNMLGRSYKQLSGHQVTMACKHCGFTSTNFVEHFKM